jgi:hypothetical protein
MNSALFADILTLIDALLHVAAVYMVRRYNGPPLCFEGRGASCFRSLTSKQLIEIMRRLSSEPLGTAGVSLGEKARTSGLLYQVISSRVCSRGQVNSVTPPAIYPAASPPDSVLWSQGWFLTTDVSNSHAFKTKAYLQYWQA